MAASPTSCVEIGDATPTYAVLPNGLVVPPAVPPVYDRFVAPALGWFVTTSLKDSHSDVGGGTVQFKDLGELVIDATGSRYITDTGVGDSSFGQVLAGGANRTMQLDARVDF